MAHEQLTAQQDSPAHAGAEGQQDGVAAVLGGAAPGLAHQGGVGVVGQGHPAAEPGLQPVGQGHLLPALQVDGQPGDAVVAIGGAGQTDAHHRRQAVGVELADRLGDGQGHGAGHGRARGGELQLRQ